MKYAYSVALFQILYKNPVTVTRSAPVIRIICPHCHAPLSSTELEQATIDDQLLLLCPECNSVLVSETRHEADYHTLQEHYADGPLTHA